ncbi:MAG: DegQ family serine endoprotease [Lentisphaerae bacterium]|nr:DegQ family serine endoprotease [Lentisphaerota bacterium]
MTNCSATYRLNTLFSGLIAAGLLGASALAAAADDTGIALLRKMSKGFSSVAQKATPAVVFIKVEKMVSAAPGGQGFYFHEGPFGSYDDLLDFFSRGAPPLQRRPYQFLQMGQGTGFIISKDGYILTNNHIVGDADKILVKLNDGREFQARKIGGDPHSEVAVIKIEGANLPVIAFGNSDDLEIGEWVIAIGNPFGLSETLTAGIVSAKSRHNIGITDYEDFIQTDAAINPGNSGGPLLNIDGKVIGINTAIFSQTGGSLGIGFAIPINMAITIKDQLIKTGKVTRGYLGVIVQELTTDLAQSFGLSRSQGLLVTEVGRDSPAEKAGIKPGDILLEMDGRPLTTASSFRNEFALLALGKEITLKVLRDKKIQTIKMTVVPQPDSTGASASLAGSILEKLGITVENLTKEYIRRFGYQAGSGVIVTELKLGSPAQRAGLEPGDLIAGVNRQSVTSVEELQNALEAAAAKPGAILLLVKDQRTSRFIAIRLK